MAIFLKQGKSVLGVAIATSSVILSILPWLPVLLGHTQRPETDWLKFDAASLGLHWLEPIGRLFASCIVTVIMLPVEDQPLLITIVNVLLMLGFMGALIRWLWQGRKKLFQTPETRQNAQVLQYFLVAIGVEFFSLIYILHKDLTLAFRYNFIFYPALCALLAASVAELSYQAPQKLAKQILPWALIVVGIISTGFVVTDAAFAKPFAPKQIAQKLLNQSSKTDLVVIKDYGNSQDVALGLSFALATDQFNKSVLEPPIKIDWGFTKSADPTENRLAMKERTLGVKRTLGAKLSPISNPLTLWRISSLGINKTLMSEKLKLKISETPGSTKAANCLAPQPPFSVMGLTYQRYNCKAS